MKLYVDDIRDAPDSSWTLVRTISEAIRCIAFFQNDITEISLDHDISAEVMVNGVYRPFPTEETFQPVAYFIGIIYKDRAMAKEVGAKITCLSGDCPERIGGECRHGMIPKITIHSANPIGAESMEYALGRYGIGCEIKPMREAYRP